MKISKRDAACEQLEQAIHCFHEDKLASAITLAGAAEGMLPSQSGDGLDLFAHLKKGGLEKLNISSESELIGKILNKPRNWLKHDQEGGIEIDKLDAAIMILRAYTRYTSNFQNDPVPKAMFKFENFMRSEYPEWIQN